MVVEGLATQIDVRPIRLGIELRAVRAGREGAMALPPDLSPLDDDAIETAVRALLGLPARAPRSANDN